jgi:hypothetical protein
VLVGVVVAHVAAVLLDLVDAESGRVGCIGVVNIIDVCFNTRGCIVSLEDGLVERILGPRPT